jgi:hypothetical protein
MANMPTDNAIGWMNNNSSKKKKQHSFYIIKNKLLEIEQ